MPVTLCAAPREDFRGNEKAVAPVLKTQSELQNLSFWKMCVSPYNHI